jgi:hypothetical protein
MEIQMNDYRLIELNIRRARLEHSVVMGELIAHGIFVSWTAAKRVATGASTRFKTWLETPPHYSTALPRRF